MLSLSLWPKQWNLFGKERFEVPLNSSFVVKFFQIAQFVKTSDVSQCYYKTGNYLRHCWQRKQVLEL